MLGKKDSYVSISLSEEALKIVRFKGTETVPKVTAISQKDIKGVSEEDVPKIINSTLSRLKAKSSNVVFVVPPNMTTVKNIEIPSVNPDEIKSIVNLQAGRHTPFSREEIQIGYINLGIYKNNYTKVLLVIANRNVLKKQLGLLEKAGLRIQKVLFSPEGMTSFYSHALNNFRYSKRTIQEKKFKK